MKFDGKVAVVTGASSGIGLAVAGAFIEAGAEVVGVSRTRSTLEGARNYWSLLCDLGGWPLGDSLAEEVLKMFQRVDVLVNAAGAFRTGSVESQSDADWRYLINLNLRAPFRLIKDFAPALRASKGAVVNVSSVNATRPFAGCVAYNVSKAALSHLTRSAAVDLAPDVRVNAVEPGLVVTQLHARAGMSADDYYEFLSRSVDTHPLGRPASPDEVSQAVLFLAGHDWITGACLPVDGGRHLTVLR